MFASGSWDGAIRLWALEPGLRSFRFLFDVPAPGVVNSLQLLTPAIERMEQYPVDPSQWRRRGGVHAPLHHAEQQDQPRRSAASLRDTVHTSADGRVLGHKESIPPLLIAAVGPEPRADRWIHIPDAVSAALVVPLWLEGSDT